MLFYPVFHAIVFILQNKKIVVVVVVCFIRTQKKQLIIIEDKIEQRLQIGRRQLNDIRYNMHKKSAWSPHLVIPQIYLSIFVTEVYLIYSFAFRFPLVNSFLPFRCLFFKRLFYYIFFVILNDTIKVTA